MRRPLLSSQWLLRLSILCVWVSICSVVNAFSSSTTQSSPALVFEDLRCEQSGGTVSAASPLLLDGVSGILERGSRTGLVGRNGCGKSTLLRILAAECARGRNDVASDLKYDGRVEVPRDVRVAYVEQEPLLSPSYQTVTVGDAVLGVSGFEVVRTSEAYDAVRKYRRALTGSPEELAEATERMGQDSWEILTLAEEVSERLRVRHLEDVAVSRLSGGERKRVALAAALVTEPDLLLLDEPTNHLDLRAVRWLTDFLSEKSRRQGGGSVTVLTITHDRRFLEDVCDRVLELDRGKLYSYRDFETSAEGDIRRGGYSAYVAGKEARLVLEDAEARAARAKYRKELEWMRRQPQARQTKSRARTEAFADLEANVKSSTGDTRPDASMDLLHGKDAREERRNQRRIGTNVMKLKDVSLSFGNRKILDGFSYDFNRGDRIGIVGANGVGKSTFLKVLTGSQSIDHGIVETGETIVFGVYDQMGLLSTSSNDDDNDTSMAVDNDRRVLEFVQDRVLQSETVAASDAFQEATKLLRRFQFPQHRWNERIAVLSGGERRRLQLLSVLCKRPNVLVLDEPTNDVDLDTLSALEEYLGETYKSQGVLLVVSHDRLFVDRVTDHLFVFEGEGRIQDYQGSLSDYADDFLSTDMTSSSSTTTQEKESKRNAAKEDKERRTRRMNQLRKWRKEQSTLESSIEKLRTKADAYQTEIDASSDEGWSVLADLTEKVNAILQDIEDKELRWLELGELLEEAESETESALVE